MPLALPALVTLLAVLWYVVTGIQVGRMRTRYGVRAPATTGDPAFERAFRVQMNELEQLVAFLPAVVLGLLAGKFIKGYLFNPWVICFTLIVGGAILLWVDQLELKPVEHDATRFPLLMYLWIGIAQCLAMIPGVSRSGASIVAAMLLGADKRSAAEFSFFLAIPTMIGAFAYDFYKSHGEMTSGNLGIVAIGFVVSFITAMIVVKTFLTYVQRHGFALFAWWRVIVGTIGLIALAMGM